jgi:hypothetical protein
LGSIAMPSRAPARIQAILPHFAAVLGDRKYSAPPLTRTRAKNCVSYITAD